MVNRAGENLGEIEELMIDLENGRVAYAVVSFGGFVGIGNKLFAVPFEALELDAENHCFVLDVPREKLEKAPGFDKDKWPDFADPRFRRAGLPPLRDRSARQQVSRRRVAVPA